MIASDDHIAGVLPRIGWVLFRLFCMIVGAKLINAIYRPATNQNDEDGPVFSAHWRKNAREVIFGVAFLAAVFYILEGGKITIDGFGVLSASVLLILFVTGETILGNWEDTLDAVGSLPGPFILKVVVGIIAFLIAAAVSIYYLMVALWLPFDSKGSDCLTSEFGYSNVDAAGKMSLVFGTETTTTEPSSSKGLV